MTPERKITVVRAADRAKMPSRQPDDPARAELKKIKDELLTLARRVEKVAAQMTTE